ncbi:MAG: prephenate dehydrogenase/arogenate dehydrogenase family protein [Deltaproteobacteria bacterium]|nr:prephenate dehydrogenase/arogenate dehydrogenase family protein [Deltaproteobacteria bacterium]
MTAQPTPHPPGTPKIIALIGGTGGMGRMMTPLLEGLGHTVLAAGRSTPLTPEDAARRAEVVIVTVPIHHTQDTIARLAPLLGPEKLFSDFTSIKRQPVEAMLASPAAVIGCHPIFGPMPNPAGQNVVLCPARPGPWLDWYEHLYLALGMKVSRMTPEEHDRSMAVIQGLTHFINISFAATLESRQVNLEQVLQVCSPVYRVAFAMLSRILSGDPALYREIQLANPENLPILEEFLGNASRLKAMVGSADGPGFDDLFTHAAGYLGPYLATARRESDWLVEQMRRKLTEDGR